MTGATRLGFAVLLKFLDIEARLPLSAEEVPPAAVTCLAEQLKLDSVLFTGYGWTGRTINYHREQLRAAFEKRFCELTCSKQVLEFSTLLDVENVARAPSLGHERPRRTA